MVFDYCHKQGSLPFALVDDEVEEADSMNLLVVSLGREEMHFSIRAALGAMTRASTRVATEEIREKADLLVKILRERVKNHLTRRIEGRCRLLGSRLRQVRFHAP